MIKRLSVCAILACCTLMVTACSEKEKDHGDLKGKAKVIATGTQMGVYYTGGLAIADLVNEQEGYKHLVVESTGGGVDNINYISSDRASLAFIQSDLQYQAAKGLGVWAGKPQKKIRFICSLHPEVVAVVASADSNIRHIRDLRYKNIDVGVDGSGSRSTALDILHTLGIDKETDVVISGSSPEEAIKLLKNGSIDAFFYTSAQPNNMLSEVVSGYKVTFVPISGFRKLVSKKPYYVKSKIPVNYYPEAFNKSDIESLGLYTNLVVSSDLTDDEVYSITKTIFENLREFKTYHPSFISLAPAEMVKGAFVPMHPGAVKYYKEKGLL